MTSNNADLDLDNKIKLNDLIYLQAFINNVYDSNIIDDSKIEHIASYYEENDSTLDTNMLALEVLKKHIITEKFYFFEPEPEPQPESEPESESEPEPEPEPEPESEPEPEPEPEP